MAFRSNLERSIAKALEAGNIEYKYECTKLPYTLHCNYIPDFLLPNGIYLEAKGYLDSDDRRKMLAVKDAHPELDIRFVFQSPYVKISKGSKTTFAKWAEKNGFPWCSHHSIPESWLSLKTNAPTKSKTESKSKSD